MLKALTLLLAAVVAAAAATPAERSTSRNGGSRNRGARTRGSQRSVSEVTIGSAVVGTRSEGESFTFPLAITPAATAGFRLTYSATYDLAQVNGIAGAVDIAAGATSFDLSVPTLVSPNFWTNDGDATLTVTLVTTDKPAVATVSSTTKTSTGTLQAVAAAVSCSNVTGVEDTSPTFSFTCGVNKVNPGQSIIVDVQPISYGNGDNKCWSTDDATTASVIPDFASFTAPEVLTWSFPSDGTGVDTTFQVNVNVLNDDIQESTKMFQVMPTITSSPGGYTWTSEPGYGILADNEYATLTLTAVTPVVEGTGANSPLATIVLSHQLEATSTDLQFTYTSSPTYSSVQTSYNIAGGRVSNVPPCGTVTDRCDLTGTLVDDAVISPDLTFDVTFDQASPSFVYYFLGSTKTATVTVQDNEDATLYLSGPPSQSEALSPSMLFRVALSHLLAPAQSFTVTLKTRDGTATSGIGDITGAFPPQANKDFDAGEVSHTIDSTNQAAGSQLAVQINNDDFQEYDEVFYVDMTANVGDLPITVSTSTAEGHIVNDKECPTIVITGGTNEGDNVVFDVILSHSFQHVLSLRNNFQGPSVQVTTKDGTLAGSTYAQAVQGQDYQGKSGPVRWPFQNTNGPLSQRFAVTTYPSTTASPPKEFLAVLVDGSYTPSSLFCNNGVIKNAEGAGLVAAGTPGPHLIIRGGRATEFIDPKITFTVELSEALSNDATFDVLLEGCPDNSLASCDGLATVRSQAVQRQGIDPAAGLDFARRIQDVGAPPDFITFSAGQTGPILVSMDLMTGVVEPVEETFTLILKPRSDNVDKVPEARAPGSIADSGENSSGEPSSTLLNVVGSAKADDLQLFLYYETEDLVEGTYGFTGKFDSSGTATPNVDFTATDISAQVNTYWCVRGAPHYGDDVCYMAVDLIDTNWVVAEELSVGGTVEGFTFSSFLSDGRAAPAVALGSWEAIITPADEGATLYVAPFTDFPEAGGTMNFPIFLSHATTVATAVNLQIYGVYDGGNAGCIEGKDFNLPSTCKDGACTTAPFPTCNAGPECTSVTLPLVVNIAVEIIDDIMSEALREMIWVEIESATEHPQLFTPYMAPGSDMSYGVIQIVDNDDSVVSIESSARYWTEFDENTAVTYGSLKQFMEFRIILSHPIDRDVAVQLMYPQGAIGGTTAENAGYTGEINGKTYNPSNWCNSDNVCVQQSGPEFVTCAIGAHWNSQPTATGRTFPGQNCFEDYIQRPNFTIPSVVEVWDFPMALTQTAPFLTCDMSFDIVMDSLDVLGLDPRGTGTYRVSINQGASFSTGTITARTRFFQTAASQIQEVSYPLYFEMNAIGTGDAIVNEGAILPYSAGAWRIGRNFPIDVVLNYKAEPSAFLDSRSVSMLDITSTPISSITFEPPQSAKPTDGAGRLNQVSFQVAEDNLVNPAFTISPEPSVVSSPWTLPSAQCAYVLDKMSKYTSLDSQVQAFTVLDNEDATVAITLPTVINAEGSKANYAVTLSHGPCCGIKWAPLKLQYMSKGANVDAEPATPGIALSSFVQQDVPFDQCVKADYNIDTQSTPFSTIKVSTTECEQSIQTTATECFSCSFNGSPCSFNAPSSSQNFAAIKYQTMGQSPSMTITNTETAKISLTSDLTQTQLGDYVANMTMADANDSINQVKCIEPELSFKIVAADYTPLDNDIELVNSGEVEAALGGTFTKSGDLMRLKTGVITTAQDQTFTIELKQGATSSSLYSFISYDPTGKQSAVYQALGGGGKVSVSGNEIDEGGQLTFEVKLETNEHGVPITYDYGTTDDTARPQYPPDTQSGQPMAYARAGIEYNTMSGTGTWAKNNNDTHTYNVGTIDYDKVHLDSLVPFQLSNLEPAGLPNLEFDYTSCVWGDSTSKICGTYGLAKNVGTAEFSFDTNEVTGSEDQNSASKDMVFPVISSKEIDFQGYQVAYCLSTSATGSPSNHNAKTPTNYILNTYTGLQGDCFLFDTTQSRSPPSSAQFTTVDDLTWYDAASLDFTAFFDNNAWIFRTGDASKVYQPQSVTGSSTSQCVGKISQENIVQLNWDTQDVTFVRQECPSPGSASCSGQAGTISFKPKPGVALGDDLQVGVAWSNKTSGGASAFPDVDFEMTSTSTTVPAGASAPSSFLYAVAPYRFAPSISWYWELTNPSNAPKVDVATTGKLKTTISASDDIFTVSANMPVIRRGAILEDSTIELIVIDDRTAADSGEKPNWGATQRAVNFQLGVELYDDTNDPNAAGLGPFNGNGWTSSNPPPFPRAGFEGYEFVQGNSKLTVPVQSFVSYFPKQTDGLGCAASTATGEYCLAPLSFTAAANPYYPKGNWVLQYHDLLTNGQSQLSMSFDTNAPTVLKVPVLGLDPSTQTMAYMGGIPVTPLNCPSPFLPVLDFVQGEPEVQMKTWAHAMTKTNGDPVDLPMAPLLGNITFNASSCFDFYGTNETERLFSLDIQGGAGATMISADGSFTLSSNDIPWDFNNPLQTISMAITAQASNLPASYPEPATFATTTPTLGTILIELSVVMGSDVTTQLAALVPNPASTFTNGLVLRVNDQWSALIQDIPEKYLNNNAKRCKVFYFSSGNAVGVDDCCMVLGVTDQIQGGKDPSVDTLQPLNQSCIIYSTQLATYPTVDLQMRLYANMPGQYKACVGTILYDEAAQCWNVLVPNPIAIASVPPQFGIIASDGRFSKSLSFYVQGFTEATKSSFDVNATCLQQELVNSTYNANSTNIDCADVTLVAQLNLFQATVAVSVDNAKIGTRITVSVAVTQTLENALMPGAFIPANQQAAATNIIFDIIG